VNQEFQVAQGTQTITFGALAGRTFGDAPFDLSSLATIPSGLPVTFQVVSGPGTISGTTLTMTGAGSIAIRASQPGNSNYTAAANVDQTLAVAKKEPDAGVRRIDIRLAGRESQVPDRLHHADNICGANLQRLEQCAIGDR
jgi:hypothetical protein